MATIITDEQRVALRKNPRFDDMVKAAVSNFATYIHDNDGSNPPGMTHVEWAKQRFFVAEPIVQHPDQQDVNAWGAQFIVFLKGAEVWTQGVDPQTDEDATIDYMISTSKFEQLANVVFALRGNNVTF